MKKTKFVKRIFLIFMATTVLTSMLMGDLRQATSSTLDKTNTLEFVLYDANQIRAWFGNNGHFVSHIPTGNSGLEWPSGSGNTAVFASGLWIIGTVDGELRSAVAEYSSEFQPGSIDYDPSTGVVGVPNNPVNPHFQVSSINKTDSSDPNNPNYNREYDTWPASDGAPAHDGEYFTDDNNDGFYNIDEDYEDFNGDGQYNGPDGELVTGEDPPQIMGDQMHWYVMNDADSNRHSHLWNTQPLNIEVQTTTFGYDRADPLGNIMFMKWLVINKSGASIEDTYIAIWSDGDLGDASDDYVGCDTSLSVGYYYNGVPIDQMYGITPPALGFDFLQGPIVPSPGNTALVSGKVIEDYRNLPMTSFIRILKSSPTFSDPENAGEAYNYMMGLHPNGDPIFDLDGFVTTFTTTGNPNSGIGWTEFDDHNVGGPGDRRMIMSSGPFTMETWTDSNDDGLPQVGEPGVQEIVAAIVIAASTNNLDAIDAMKYYDQFAQNAYDSQFSFPGPVDPKVLASELDEQIILSWYENSETVEGFEEYGYNFQGYNVYQGESPNGPWTRIATYDIIDNITTIIDRELNIDIGLTLEVAVQFGTDSGISRMIDIRIDAIDGHIDLRNGRQYYYAVTNYVYNAEGTPKTAESAKSAIVVRPHMSGVGEEVIASSGDNVAVIQTGNGQAKISATIIDPVQVTGDSYKVGFNYDSTNSSGSWYFGRIDNDTVIAVDDTLFESSTLNNFTTDIIEGIKVSVKDISFDVPLFNAGWEQTSNAVENQLITKRFLAISPGGVDHLFWNENGDTASLDTMYGPDYYYDYFEIVDGVETYFDLFRAVSHEVYVSQFAGDVPGATNDLISSLRGIGGGITDPELIQSDLQIRFTEEGSNASIWSLSRDYQPADTLTHVPYEIWDIERNVRLGVGIADNNNSGSNSGMIIDGEETLLTLDNDWVVTMHEDYYENENTIYPLYNNDASGWMFTFSSASKYSIGDTVNLYFLNPVKPGIDEYIFTPEVLKTTTNQAELDKQIDLINVFPNPYYGTYNEEVMSLNHYVMFSHLPAREDIKCIIRIYSVGGHLVNKIEHHNSAFSGSTFDQWDLKNSAGKTIARGMYIIHIEVENMGNKILKLAVFPLEE